jgi:hypothetical protein
VEQAPTPEAETPATPATQAVPGSASSKTAAQKAQKKPSAAQPAPAPAPQVAPPIAAPVAPPVAAPAPHPQAAGLGFDPKKIDPKENARLKFDLSHIPGAVNFVVEMDGKTFYKGSAGNKGDYDNLYVPPGLHQFRVQISAGSLEKTSNTVSFQFVAKKNMTLRVDMKPQPNASVGGVPVIDPATQVVATLKAGFSLFN